MEIHCINNATSSFWDSNFFAGVAGALLGAVVGGGISWMLQSSAFNRETRQNEKDARERNRLTCMSIGFKTHNMLEQINMIRRHFTDELRKLPEGDIEHPFRFVQPIVNVFDDIRFTTDELALILSKDSQLANELVVLQQIHNTRLAAVATYNRIRISLLEVMQVHEAKAQIGTTILDGGERARLLPRWLALDNIIEQTMASIDNELSDAKKAVISVSETLETHFDVKFRVQFNENAAGISREETARVEDMPQ